MHKEHPRWFTKLLQGGHFTSNRPIESHHLLQNFNKNASRIAAVPPDWMSTFTRYCYKAKPCVLTMHICGSSIRFFFFEIHKLFERKTGEIKEEKNR